MNLHKQSIDFIKIMQNIILEVENPDRLYQTFTTIKKKWLLD